MEAAVQQNLASYSSAERWLIRLLPSFTDFAFLFPILWLFVVMNGTATLLSDGDTGWHIRTGEWIWNHRAVPATDLFSFTRPNGAWYAWEWLWDLLFAGIHHMGGLGAVAFVNVCLLGLVSVLLFRLIRRATGNDLLSLAAAVLAMGASTIHWLARPHLVTWIFVLVFAHVLLSAKLGKNKGLFCLPVLMLLWVNLHGGFFLGILMLLLAAAGELAGAFLHARSFWDAAYFRSRYYLGCALACSLATFANPYGVQLHNHIAHYVLDRKLLSRIGEFQSINFHNPLAFFFEAMLLVALPAALWAAMRKQYATALGVLFWAHLALFSSRNIPIFAFLTAAPVACMLDDLLRRVSLIHRLQMLSVSVAELATSIQPFERANRLYFSSALATVVMGLAFAAHLPGFEPRFNTATFPVSALPFIRSAKFSHLFTTDTWASYFVYNLYPHQPSFMDGRSDYFGNDFLDRYARVMDARWDWEAELDRYAVDSVALQPDVPVVAALKASRNWQLVFDDGAVVVFGNVRRAQLTGNDARTAKISPAQRGGGKELGLSQPGRIVNFNSKTQERRS